MSEEIKNLKTGDDRAFEILKSFGFAGIAYGLGKYIFDENIKIYDSYNIDIKKNNLDKIIGEYNSTLIKTENVDNYWKLNNKIKNYCNKYDICENEPFVTTIKAKNNLEKWYPEFMPTDISRQKILQERDYLKTTIETKGITPYLDQFEMNKLEIVSTIDLISLTIIGVLAYKSIKNMHSLIFKNHKN